MTSLKAFVRLLVSLAAVLVAQPASSQETKRIRFAVTNPPHFLPIWLAKDTGIFSKHGLDVEVIFMRGGALITMGILSGELQLSGVGAESVVAAKVEGGDAVLLACPLDTDLVYLIGRPDIKTPEQLKGKATAVTRLGSSIHFYLRSALKYLGMDADKDMTILQLGGGPEIAAALETGRIAAGILTIRYALPFLQLAGADRLIENRSQISAFLRGKQPGLCAQESKHRRAFPESLYRGDLRD
jgi:ABC-type nitrate/sulfonate/bicarbonate transport system substrate-binding protein